MGHLLPAHHLMSALARLGSTPRTDAQTRSQMSVRLVYSGARAAGGRSGFLSGPQKLFKNKCGELAFSASQAHLYHICIMGCETAHVWTPSVNML